MKILYVPLDERPCNAVYPVQAASVARDLTVVALPEDLMGHKKIPAETEPIWQFLEHNLSQVDAAVLSTEMLVFGGLLPSRIHHLQDNAIAAYAAKMRAIHQDYPQVKLYLSDLIMRTPKYSSADEEPDYYGEYGSQIFRYGWLKDQKHRQKLTPSEQQELDGLSDLIPQTVLKDYEARRAFNVALNLINLQLVSEGVIHFLSIPQDDSAPYGYTAMDQKQVYGAIGKKGLLGRVLVYPGADEVGYTLLARAYAIARGFTPKLAVQFSATLGPTLIPNYEDRPVGESLKSHVLAAGFQLTDTRQEADVYLAYNTPGLRMQESWDQFDHQDVTYSSYRNLLTFVGQIQTALTSGKPVAVCDAAYSNGGDLALLKLLDQRQAFTQLAGYQGWNTNCNSLGATLATLMFALSGKRDLVQERVNNLRAVADDGCYQAKVRRQVTDKVLPALSANYFDLKEQGPKIRSIVVSQIVQTLKATLPNTLEARTVSVDVEFPWNRMFEIQCRVTL